MTSTPPPTRARFWIVLGSIVGVLAIVAIVIAAIVPRSGDQPTAANTPGFKTTPLAPFTPSVPTALATATAAPPRSTPLPFTATSKVATGVTIKVTKIEKVNGTASEPGEIAGPSIRFTITIANATSKDLALNTIAVNTYYGAKQTPAVVLTQPGGKPFPNAVVAGATATGIYVYNVPIADRADVRLTVDYTVNTPTVIFRGAIS